MLKVEMRKEEPKFDLCPDNCPIFFPLITCIRIKHRRAVLGKVSVGIMQCAKACIAVL